MMITTRVVVVVVVVVVTILLLLLLQLLKNNNNKPIIALKGTIRDLFYNFLTAPRTISNTYAQVARAQSSAHQFGRVETACILALFHWLKPLTDEGAEETGVPEENP